MVINYINLKKSWDKDDMPLLSGNIGVLLQITHFRKIGRFRNEI